MCRKNQQSKSVAIHRKQSCNKWNPWDHITRVHKTIPFFTGFWIYKPAKSTATNSSFENLLPVCTNPCQNFRTSKKMLLREANLEQQQRSYKLFLLFFCLRNGQKNLQTTATILQISRRRKNSLSWRVITLREKKTTTTTTTNRKMNPLQKMHLFKSQKYKHINTHRHTNSQTKIHLI